MKREIWMGSAGLVAGAAAGWIAAFHGANPAPFADKLSATAVAVDFGVTTAPTATAAATGESSPACRPPEPTTPELRAWLIAWLQRGAPAKERKVALAKLDAWAKVAPDDALNFVANAPRFPGRNEALARPLAVITQRDVPRAVAWLQNRQTDAERETIVRHVVGRIHEETPHAALALVEKMGGELACFIQGDLLRALAKRSPADALHALRLFPEGNRYSQAQHLAEGWAAHDPAGAIRWSCSEEAGEFAHGAQRGVLQFLLGQRSPELGRVLQENPKLRDYVAGAPYLAHRIDADQQLALMPYLSKHAQAAVLGDILQEELPLDPTHAIRVARELLPADQAASAIVGAWKQWMDSDRKAALAWVEAQTDPALREAIRRHQHRELAGSDPARFLAETASSEEPAEHESVSLALHELAAKDARAAVAWMNSNPSHLTAELTHELVLQLARGNEEIAASWAASLPAGSMQDDALANLGMRWAGRGDVELAASAIDGITDPERKLVARVKAYWTLSDRAPDKARAWLDSQFPDPAVRAMWIALAKHRH